MKDKVLWESLKYRVQKVLEGRSSGNLKIVDKQSGVCDWPIMYGKTDSCVNIGLDYPHRWPSYVESVVRVIYQDDYPLYKKIKLELCSMIAFIDEHGGSIDNLPGYPSLYLAYDWQKENTPVHVMWEEFKQDLKGKKLEATNELDLENLLEESRDPIPF